MFVLTTIVDTIKIPPHMLSVPTKVAVHREMDVKYSNRVLMDVGLIVCRYGDCLSIGDGVCVPGEGGAHHECVVRLVVFRPFVEEVCLGTIAKSSEEGIKVSLGEFFEDIFIPAYWMLRPSHYEADKRIWVWTPQYGEDNDNDNNNDGGGDTNNANEEGKEAAAEAADAAKVKAEDVEADEEGQGGEEENRFEMEIGAEVRFRVKSINFTQVTTTAKGVLATTTTTASQMSHNNNSSNNSSSIKNETNTTTTSDGVMAPPVRKRSLSVELSDSQQAPASMHIVASICEDGLGLTTWWTAQEEEEPGEGGDDET